MKIWVDADSCPRKIREIISRAAKKRQVSTVFVADRILPLPSSPHIVQIQVEKGEGSTDRYIAAHIQSGDLAITRDVPLAYELAHLGGIVLDDSGNVFTKDNVGERLSARNFMRSLREGGVQPEVTKPLEVKDLVLFANSFDRELTRMQGGE
ncbi:MAG: hypothetical protein CMN78_05270 [Spirochaetales bacterium]|nr:hypothetical protein [Spirochaetales bacterium]